MKILAAFVLICALPTPNLFVSAIENGTDIVTYPFHMADVGASEEDTDRDDKLMTNINQCLDGYNIFFGNPTPINEHMDPGFRHQIFKADYKKHTLTGDHRYLQPDGVEIRDCIGSCTTDFQTTQISGAKSYQKSLSNKVSAKVGGSYAGFGGSFTASTDFTDVQGKTSKEEKIITRSTADCCSYKAKISEYSPPKLTNDFKNAVEKLPQKFNDEYFRFLDYFGTHYIHMAEYGAIYGMQAEITRKQWTTMTEKGISIDTAASATAYGVTVEGGYKNEKKEKEAEEFKKHSTHRRTFSIGELPPKSGDINDWVQKAKSSPAPMHLELDLISRILGNPAMKFRKPVSRAIIKNLEKALKKYCTKWLIKKVKSKYPNFSCSEPEDKGLPVPKEPKEPVKGEQNPKFTPPMAGCLWGYDDVTHEKVSSMKKCQKFCKAKSWCRSVDYIAVKEVCYLSKETKMTVPTYWYEKCYNHRWPDWYLSSRYSEKI